MRTEHHRIIVLIDSRGPLEDNLSITRALEREGRWRALGIATIMLV